MRNKRLFMMLSVLALSIGFATVSTVLYINGTSGISANVEDLEQNVIFTDASIDDGGSTSILQEGKKIEFETKTLEKANDKARISYEMTNLSKNYNVSAKVVCALDTEDETTNTYKDIVNFQVDEDEYTLASGNKKNGYVEITILHNPEHEVDLKFGCEIVATAIGRDIVGTPTITNANVIDGIMMDSDGNPLTSGYLAVFSDEMKVVEIASNGSVNIEGLEDGTHEIYYMGSTNPTDLVKGEIKESALASGLYATSSTTGVIELKKGDTTYTIAKVYDVTFEVSNATINPTSLKYIVGKENKITITPESGYYVESIVCTNGYTTNAVTGEEATEAQEITINGNGNNENSVCTINMIQD